MVSIIPELRMLLNSLITALPRLGYVAALIFIIFYIYAAAGSLFFERINPALWGNIAVTMLTLFRVMTFEDWTDVMYKAMELSPFYAAYFVSFVIIGTFVVINLFIAVVINNLDEAKYAYLRKLDHPELHDQLLQTLVSTKASIQDLEKQLQTLKDNAAASPQTPATSNSLEQERPV